MSKVFKGLTLSAVVFSAGYFALSTYTPPFTGTNGKELEESIAVLEKVKLGGIDQWIIIRGSDASRPLLLFLHGGPGATAAPLVRKLLPELEDLFVVVHWEQRGAGKSFSSTIPAESMTVEQFVSDTAELSKMLLKRFNRNKLFLLGASWGSFLGISTVKKHPDLYYAYIGAGQVVYQAEGEKISYDFVLRKAREANDEEALSVLKRIGRPPYPKDRSVRYLQKQRRLLRKYRGSIYEEVNLRRLSDPRHVLFQKEYNFMDKINWLRGQYFSEKHLGLEFRNIDLSVEASEIEVPIVLVQGKHDWHTPTVLVEKYFDVLKAPKKELHIFEKSAHVPIGEEPEKFIRIVKERVLPLNRDTLP